MHRAIAILLTLSGACGLVYEVVWTRYLVLVLGNTSAAHTVVLATFMAGLGIGYAALAQLADRAQRPLLVYGALELGIGLWAAAFDPLFHLLLGWSAPGLVLAVVGLLPPTIAMGATLPLVVRAAAPDPDRAAGTIGLLYAANSAGAVVGGLLAGFVLLPLLGAHKTLLAGAGFNLLVGAAAMALGRRHRPPPAVYSQPAEGNAWFVVAAAGVCGLAALILQVLWIRVFAVILGSSTYSFTVIVAAFIAGIALGGAVVERFRPRMSDPGRVFAIAAGLAAVVALLPAPLFSWLPYAFARLKLSLPLTEAGFLGYQAVKAGITLAVMLVPTLLSGMLLPLAGEVAGRRLGAVGAGVGAAFSVNTAGAVVGAALAGPVLIPALGLTWTLRLGAGLFAVAAAMVAITRRRDEYRTRGPMVAGLVALAAFVLLWPARWDPLLFMAGEFRTRRSVPSTWQEWAELGRRDELLFYEDGPNVSVAIVGRGEERFLRINGKTDASNRGDMITQIMSAHVPMTLSARAETVLVVGFGSGVTAGSARRHGAKVDLVEISGAVLRAGEFFKDVNGDVLRDPGVTTHQGDAKTYLRGTDRKWDVIISEPSNPWIAGNSALFSVDWFKAVRGHLAPGGVLAQWFHLYEMDDESVRLILRSLTTVFDHVALYELFPNDILLVASNWPPEPHPERLVGDVRADLERVSVPGWPGIESLRVMDAAAVRAVAGEGPVNTDDHPRLEFSAPRALFRRSRATLLDGLDRRHRPDLSGVALPDLEQLFVLHTLYPGAPPAYRDALLDRLLDRSAAPFLTQVLHTLLEEKRLDRAEQVAGRLDCPASQSVEVLYPCARLGWRLAVRDKDVAAVEGARALARRCVRLGDDAQGRCRKLLKRIP